MAEMRENFLDVYRKVQERFGLPHLGKLQAVFQLEIDDLEDIHQLRADLSAKLFDFTETIIEPLIWCNSHCHAIERGMLSPEENAKLFKLYKHVQALKWKNNFLKIKPDSNASAQWLVELWDFWQEFEPFVTKLCIKFSKGWKNLKIKSEPVEYQG
jgi:hypothetical protein